MDDAEARGYRTVPPTLGTVPRELSELGLEPRRLGRPLAREGPPRRWTIHSKTDWARDYRNQEPIPSRRGPTGNLGS